MKRYLNIFCVLFVFVFSFGSTAQTAQLFEQGKEKYAAGQYQEAIDAWSQILDAGEHDANLYFNLGNAHYKLNKIGPSVYYYEKALQLDPLDRDIKNNLSFAENARVDAIEPLPKTIFSKWYSQIAGTFTYNGWAWTAVICSALFVILFLLYYFSVYEKSKRLYFIGSIISILAVVFTLVFAFQTYSDFQNDTPAIIFAESTELREGPNMGSPLSFVLHEGTKVQILTKENDWVRVALADGKDGWMPASDLKRL